MHKRYPIVNNLYFACRLTEKREYDTKEPERAGEKTMDLEEYYKIIHDGRPKLRFCERFDETSSKWNFSRHAHPYLELMYFIDGKGEIEVSGTQMSISLFDTVVYPAGWAHQEASVSEKLREIICLWVDLPELQLKEPIQLHDRDNCMSNLFWTVYQEAKRERPEPFILECALKLLLTCVLRGHSEAMAHELAPAYALQYIHAHYTEHITLDQLAALEHISKSYLSRQFRQRTGMTVIAYVNRLRIEAAKRLLTASDKGVNEIAYQVGFESPKYFYRTFRNLTGVPPAAFRRQYSRTS